MIAEIRANASCDRIAIERSVARPETGAVIEQIECVFEKAVSGVHAPAIADRNGNRHDNEDWRGPQDESGGAAQQQSPESPSR